MNKFCRILVCVLALAMLFVPMALATGAEGAGEAEGSAPGLLAGFGSLIMFVPLILIFYFMIIRPEKKRKAAAAQLRNDLMVTDEVTTMGGIIGKVVQIKDDQVVIETGGERTRITIQRAAIVTRKEKISE